MNSPPVLFLIFNRPELTARVFARIREAKPTHLFVAADGPRRHKAGEAELCCRTRRIVDAGIDWDCQVVRLYRDENLGCKVAVSSAITWFFGQVESGMILEDDCLPELTFFPYCAEVLRQHRDNVSVMHISGFNPTTFGDGKKASYHCWHFGSIWGWATWRRAWAHYDVNMTAWPEFVSAGRLRAHCTSDLEANARMAAFENTYRGGIDTWDFQWAFARLLHHGISLTPTTNLISNLGFGADATHTVNAADRRSNTKTQSIDFPIIHPSAVSHCMEFGAAYWEGIHECPGPRPSIGYRIARLLFNPKRALKYFSGKFQVFGLLTHGGITLFDLTSL